MHDVLWDGGWWTNEPLKIQKSSFFFSGFSKVTHRDNTMICVCSGGGEGDESFLWVMYCVDSNSRKKENKCVCIGCVRACVCVCVVRNNKRTSTCIWRTSETNWCRKILSVQCEIHLFICIWISINTVGVNTLKLWAVSISRSPGSVFSILPWNNIPAVWIDSKLSCQ